MSNSKKLELKAHCTEMLTSQGMRIVPRCEREEAVTWMENLGSDLSRYSPHII